MINVIVDDGSSFVKAQIIGVGSPVISFPARVLNKKVQDMKTSSLISDRCYSVNNSFLSVCPNTDEPQSTNNGAEYQTSLTNLVLVHDALRLLGLGGQQVALVVTLPINLFFGSDAGINYDLIERKKNRLLSKIEHCNRQRLAEITSVTVRPEGYSLAVDALLDDNGNTKPEYEHVEKIMVVDIGGTTCDMALLSTNGQIEKFKSSKNAVFPLRDSISQKLISKFSLQDDVPVTVMDKVLHTGFLGTHDVTAIVKHCAQEQASGIIKDINVFSNNLTSVDLLVIGGGGAYSIGEHIIKQFPGVNSIIPDQPEWCVLRGYNKFTLQQ